MSLINDALKRAKEAQQQDLIREAFNTCVSLLTNECPAFVDQWILSGLAGQPDHRVRDEEFSARGGLAAPELCRLLHRTVEAAADFIRSLDHARLTERIVIQGHDVSALEAIFHVVEHFSGHTSQIIFITKMLTGEDLGFYSYLSQPQPHAGKTA